MGPSPIASGKFLSAGYAPDERLIAWRGNERHQYFELDDGRAGRPSTSTYFLARPPSCHKLDLPEAEFAQKSVALSSTELLLQKLQIVESTEKDLVDIGFLLLANPARLNGSGLDSTRIAGLLSRDWGFFHTATGNLSKVSAIAEERFQGTDAMAVADRVDELRHDMDRAPKSRKWKLRSRLGTKIPWYEQVEELDR